MSDLRAIGQFPSTALETQREQGEIAVPASAETRQGGGIPPGGLTVLIEPRTIIRDCLMRSLQDIGIGELKACASVGEWRQAEAAPCSPQVILLSTSSESLSRLTDDLAALVAPGGPPSLVVLLGDSEHADQLLAAVGQEVRGFILTDASLQVTVAALQLVRAGGTFIPASCLTPGSDSRRTKPSAPASPSWPTFTARQVSVIETLSQGKPNKVIAYELNMQESTVKIHVRGIMRKLKVRNRTELAMLVNRMHGPLANGHPCGRIGGRQ